MKSSTWNKESTELLDYESLDLIKANFTTRTESFLIRQANNVRLISSLQEKQSNAGLLLKLSFDVNNFYLGCNEAKRDEKDKNSTINWGEVSWFIVKMLKNSEGETVLIQIIIKFNFCVFLQAPKICNFNLPVGVRLLKYKTLNLG